MADAPVRVRIPATTANLGPGFDTLGLALGLYNDVELSVGELTSVTVGGEGVDALPVGRDHLVLRAADRVAAIAGVTVPGWRLRQENRIPLARGLGSSSAAIVGGLVAANALLAAGFGSDDLLDIAVEIEGHPDNVAPALFGGLTVCCANEATCCLTFPAPALQVVVAVPDFEVSTEAARKVMPQTIPFADGVFSAAHAAMTLGALVSGDFAKLTCGMRDRLHQPYRAHLVPGLEAAMAAATAAGAWSAALSGSGPTIAAFCSAHATDVAAAMVAALDAAGVRARSMVLDTDGEGAKVLL